MDANCRRPVLHEIEQRGLALTVDHVAVSVGRDSMRLLYTSIASANALLPKSQEIDSAFAAA